MTTTSVLLTLDEARDLLGTSAIALVEAVACPQRRLERLLRGNVNSIWPHRDGLKWPHQGARLTDPRRR